MSGDRYQPYKKEEDWRIRRDRDNKRDEPERGTGSSRREPSRRSSGRDSGSSQFREGERKSFRSDDNSRGSAFSRLTRGGERVQVGPDKSDESSRTRSSRDDHKGQRNQSDGRNGRRSDTKGHLNATNNQNDPPPEPEWVPRSGAFFEHDDRAGSRGFPSGRGGGPRGFRGRGPIESDSGKWKHDKFEEVRDDPKRSEDRKEATVPVKPDDNEDLVPADPNQDAQRNTAAARHPSTWESDEEDE
eukprot:c18087_g1_i2.p1 GENE.c18087_g1_i2~~c18087_g1_i2.p1  ORF type:complete len:244 (+),score=15.29 c18087_g1_i2:158-889(+)